MEPTKPTEEAQPPDDMIRMVITFNPRTERVNVFGPLSRTGLCYQMIELARDVVRRVDDKNRASELIAPPPGFNAKGAAHV